MWSRERLECRCMKSKSTIKSVRRCKGDGIERKWRLEKESKEELENQKLLEPVRYYNCNRSKFRVKQSWWRKRDDSRWRWWYISKPTWRSLPFPHGLRYKMPDYFVSCGAQIQNENLRPYTATSSQSKQASGNGNHCDVGMNRHCSNEIECLFAS